MKRGKDSKQSDSKTLFSLAGLAVGICAVAIIGSADTVDWAIWEKNAKSDTPLFRVVIADHAGYIDVRGRLVIPPQYTKTGNGGDDDFFNGLAKVRSKDGAWFINSSGRRVFPIDANKSSHFSEGMVAVLRGHKVGFLNRSGTVQIEPMFDAAGDFSDGLAIVKLGDRFGYIDSAGKLVIQASHYRAFPFSDGSARVIREGPCHPRSSPDDSGVPALIPPQHLVDTPRPSEVCRYSFIGRDGTPLFPAKFVDALDFHEGLAAVCDGERWGYISQSGNMAIPFTFQAAGEFHDGLAAIKLNGKFGYIDSTGRIVIRAVFDNVGSFSQGLAPVGQGYSTWYIDSRGNRPFTGTYTFATSFVHGLAHVRIGNRRESSKWSYIDRTGRAVFTYREH